MSTKIELIAAPTTIQPGGYVMEAYKDRVDPKTPTANIKVIPQGKGWRVELSWPCPNPIKAITQETDVFVDAAALMVPAVKDAPWITMGEAGKPVEASLWRADKTAPYQMIAEGMGSSNRNEAPQDWKAEGKWSNSSWTVIFEFGEWPALEAQKQIAIAVWRGEDADRGGLKSVSPGWISI